MKDRQTFVRNVHMTFQPKGAKQGKKWNDDWAQAQAEFWGNHMDAEHLLMRDHFPRKFQLVNSNFMKRQMLSKGWHIRKKPNGGNPQWVPGPGVIF